jgi:O-methyltransferase/8-demethyl-8-(2,3-dimethoxy-alpha-L-rhamnosyl)tetracenomycin-C 4'-O-methyltransferase
MRGVLVAMNETERRVFLADSFRGLPPPDPEQPQDAGDVLYAQDYLRVSQAQVRELFDRYGLLDDRVLFLEGWFKDALSLAPVDTIAPGGQGSPTFLTRSDKSVPPNRHRRRRARVPIL